MHNAHLELAQCALEQYQLDTVLFIPAGMPARKLGTTVASASDRLNMLELACRGKRGFEVSAIEVDRPEISYTADTLRELKEQYGEESELFLILGEDAAADLCTWKDSADIACLSTVLYARRPDYAIVKENVSDEGTSGRDASYEVVSEGYASDGDASGAVSSEGDIPSKDAAGKDTLLDTGNGPEKGVLPKGFEGNLLKMPARRTSSSCVRRLLSEGEDVSGCIPAPVLEYIGEHGLYGRPQRDLQ